MKIVSQLDPNGFFVAAVEADPSPKEQGVYLIPAGAIDTSPPVVPAGKAALWQASSWVFVDPPVTPGSEPPPSVDGPPQVVSRFQARAALHLAGLLDQVEQIMADPQTPVLSRLAWQDAQEFRRSSPTLLALADQLGLSAEALDQLFITASEIQA